MLRESPAPSQKELWEKALTICGPEPPDIEVRTWVKVVRGLLCTKENILEVAKNDSFNNLFRRAYPRIALELLKIFSRKIDEGVFSADEIAGDAAQNAFFESILKFDPQKAADLSFIRFAVSIGRYVVANRVPENCPISFVSSSPVTGVKTDDHSYKWALKWQVERYRWKEYQQHGIFPEMTQIAAHLGRSTSAIREVTTLHWESLNTNADPDTRCSELAIPSTTSPESVLIENERRRLLKEKLDNLTPEHRDRLAIALILLVGDTRKGNFSQAEVEHVENSISLLSWTDSRKAMLLKCIERHDRGGLNRALMSALGRSSSKGATRVCRLSYISEIRRILGKETMDLLRQINE